MQRIVVSRTYKDFDSPFRAAFCGAGHITIAQREVCHSGCGLQAGLLQTEHVRYARFPKPKRVIGGRGEFIYTNVNGIQ